MTLPTKDTFEFDFTTQPDYPSWTPQQTKQYMNARSEELRLAFNVVVSLLNSVTDGASGADNTAMTPIGAIGTQNNVQSIVEALVVILQSVAAGASGAKFIGAETIAGLIGNDVQALISALNNALNAHKTSSDHDSKYFTETELSAVTAAGLLGATAPSGLTGTTIQAILNALKSAIDSTVLGQIPDGSLTISKLAFDPATQVELDNLAGTGRTTETVKGNADALAEHKADYAKHIEPIIKVNTIPGTIVTITKDGIDIVETADENGLTVLNPAFLGEWIVSASVSGMPMSASITVDKVAVFETSLMPATLNVQTLAGTEVSLSKDTITIKVTADSNGLAVFRPAIGTWILSAVFSGVTVSKEVSITDTGVYNEGLSPVLADCSWADVDAFSRAGVASGIWSIGDTKALAIDGVSYVAQIIGFDHDNLTTADGARTKAGITFQLQNCLNTTYPMNSSDTNSGGWTSSLMRTSTMGTLFNQLEAGLRNVIKSVNKLTSAGDQSATINTTSDKLFLLSEIEVFGTLTYSKAGEGSQYDYYAAGNSKVKTVNGSANHWWERSPNGSYSASFCYVSSYGTASTANASGSNGVPFGFCI